MSRMLNALKMLDGQSRDDRRDDEPDEPLAQTQSAIATVAVRQRAEPVARVEAEEAREPIAASLPDPTTFETRIRDQSQSGQIGRQYRRLVDNIIANSPAGVSTSVNIVSACQACDTSETVTHVGTVLAGRHCGQILLIDADVAKKGLSSQWEFGDQPGLSSYLAGHDDWQALVRPTATSGLHFLPCGHDSYSPDDDTAGRFAALIRELQLDYRYVIVNSADMESPLRAAVSRVCDATYLLVRLGVTTAADSARAATELRDAGARLIGCIVGGAPHRP